MRGVGGDIDVTLEGGRGDVRTYDRETDTLEIVLSDVAPEDDVTVYLDTEAATLLSTRDRRRDRIEEMLWHFETDAGAKPQLLEYVEGHLSGSHDDIDWLADFAAVLTDEQLRAIAETLTGVGFERVTHADCERLLLFNGDHREDITYQFATYDNWGVPVDRSGGADRGPVPDYRVIDLEDMATFDWELTYNYDDVVQVRDSGEGVDTTQE